jgi:hypothetical protein
VNHLLTLAKQFLVLLAVFLGAGCSLMPKLMHTAQVEPVSKSAPLAPSPEGTIKLSYRTESSRLNLAANSNGIQPVSFQQQSQSPVPDFTTTTLEIRYPHPAGIPDYAAVTVLFEAQLEEPKKAISASSVWNTIRGTTSETDTAQPTQAFREVWATDLPRWQLDSLIAKLRKENFFMRAKVMNTNSFLATEIDGDRFGKSYKQVSELDAMILRIRNEGRLLNPGSSLPDPIRLPPI